MTERLGRKLGLSPAAGPVTPPTRAVRKPCFMVDEKYGFICEFQQADGTALALPYAHLDSVELAADGTSMAVLFSSHEVRIAGARLHKIKEALARSRNILVRAVEPRWKADYANDEVFVAAIQVEEMSDREPPNGSEADK